MVRTIAKCYKTNRRTAKDARVDSGKLSVHNSLQLCIPGGPLTVGCRRNDSVNVESIARMLTVRDSVGDQIVGVGDSGGIGVVNHRVGVVLLVTRIGACKERVYPVYARQLDTGLSREDISAAHKLRTR